MGQKVPILVYHHVYSDDSAALAPPSGEKATGVIGEGELRRQLAFILDNGWRVVSTTQVVDWLESGAPLPRRAVALHFDNGWLDCVTTAMPLLHELGIAATAYVITDGTTASSEGRKAKVVTSTEGATEHPFITWDHARALLEAGWEIGAHTATHPRLGDLQAKEGDGAVLREVERSNEAYARRLGFVPAHFAYPSGSRSERTDELVSRYYRSLRLWRFSNPPRWTFTDGATRPTALECQNIDNTVSFEHFTRLFAEASEG